MNYLLSNQKSVRRFYLYNKKNNYFQMKVFILLAFFTVPALPAFSKQTVKQNVFMLKSEDLFNPNISLVSSDGKIVAGNPLDDYQRAHATIWHGDNWQTKTILDTLLKDTRFHNYYISALSADGKIAGGNLLDSQKKSHATIWHGDNWQTKTVLDNLKPKNAFYESNVIALSADGKIAGGWAPNYLAPMRATIWYGDHWQTDKDLGTLVFNNEGKSYVTTLSADGKIAGGYAQSDSLKYHAVIWHGVGWEDKKDLGTFNNEGESYVTTLSADGKIAGGYGQNKSTKKDAAIWFTKDNWTTSSEPIDLDTLKNDNASSSVTKLSADGIIAVGWSNNNDSKNKRAVVWATNNNWKTFSKIDLGTFRKDNSGSSEVSVLSSDGTIIIGTADTDDGVKHTFFKRVSREAYDNLDDLSIQKNQQDTNTGFSEAPTQSLESSSAPHAPLAINQDKGFVGIPPMLDVTNTLSTISKLASDTFSIIAFQRQTLTRLQQGCISTDGYWCWSVNANTSNAITKDIVPEINVGYGLTETLSIGGVIEHALSRSFPDSHEMNGNNISLGFYAHWHVPFSFGESYLRPAVSFSQYDLGIKRSKLSNTEEGKGNSKMNGLGLSIEGGQNFILSNKMLLGWHAGVRYSQLSRNRYKENQLDYPIEYKKINYDNTSGYVGADVSVPILSPLSWVSGIEIEHSLKESELIYHAQLDKIQNPSIKAPLNHTRGIVKTGFVYKLHKNFSLSVLTSLSQTTVGDKKWNTVLSLSGQF